MYNKKKPNTWLFKLLLLKILLQPTSTFSSNEYLLYLLILFIKMNQPIDFDRQAGTNRLVSRDSC